MVPTALHNASPVLPKRGGDVVVETEALVGLLIPGLPVAPPDPLSRPPVLPDTGFSAAMIRATCKLQQVCPYYNSYLPLGLKHIHLPDSRCNVTHKS